ncbi:hypothetical protein Tco_0403841 [Tanacetum coccineum]
MHIKGLLLLHYSPHVQRSAISEAKREDIRKHGIESSNKNLDGDHEVDLQQALWVTLASDIDSRTSCPTTRTGPMPVEVTTVAKQQMPVELIITAPQLAVIPRSCADTIPKTLDPSAELVVFATFLNLWALGKAFVELLEEGINIPAWLAFNSEDGVNVVSDDSLAEMPIVLTLLILTRKLSGLAFMLSMGTSEG